MAKEQTGNSFQVCNQCRIKKIRCDREKPSCGNCVRSSQDCEWSGQGKKGNQVALLHTILGLGSRLQKVEAAVLDIHRSLKRPLESLPSNSSPASHSGQQHADDALSLQTSEPSASDDGNTSGPFFTAPRGRLFRCQGSTPGTLYFGPTSLEALILDFGESIFSHSSPDAHAPRDGSVSIHDKINAFVDTTQHKHLAEVGSPPTEPPLAILEAMIEPYFSNINPHFPIWSKEGFLRILSPLRRHSTPPEVGWASIVCCNNLILINLTAGSVRSVQRKWSQPGSGENVSSMDSQLVAGFLANSKRAIENLGLLSPCLINLQALLSSCVVAQDHLPLHLLDFIFAQAVRCAEAIGVFQWHRLKGQLTEDEFRDYKNIAHCLYILDKQICWTAGVPPRVPRRQVQLDLALSDASIGRTLAISAELATIEEAIFLEIYADGIKARTEEQVRQVVGPISQRLDSWLAKAGVDVEAVKRQPGNHPAHAALLFNSLCARLLLIWPYREHPDAIFQQRYDIAATCMRLLPSLWASTPNAGQHASVPLLIASWPPLYLIEVCTNMPNGNSDEQDRGSLRSFANLLKAIVGSKQDMFYTKRLEEISSILMDAVPAAGAVTKRRRTISSSEFPLQHSGGVTGFFSPFQGGGQQSASSQAEASDSGRNSSTNTGSLGSDHQQYSVVGGLASYSDWDELAGLMALNSSGSRDISMHLGFVAHERGSLEDDYSEELISHLALLS